MRRVQSSGPAQSRGLRISAPPPGIQENLLPWRRYRCAYLLAPGTSPCPSFAGECAQRQSGRLEQCGPLTLAMAGGCSEPTMPEAGAVTVSRAFVRFARMVDEINRR